MITYDDRVSKTPVLPTKKSRIVYDETPVDENVGEPSFREKIFDVPSASVRSALMGTGYSKGAMNYRSIPRFQDIALDKYYNLPGVKQASEGKFGLMPQQLSQAAGNIPSALGLGADIITNPAEMAITLAGGRAIKTLAPTSFGQTVGRSLTTPINRLKDIQKVFNPRLTKVPGSFERMEMARISKEGRKSVAQLLPEIKVAEKVKISKPVNAHSEAFKLIKKTSDPQDIFNKINNEKEKVLSRLDSFISKNNKSVDPISIQNRAKVLLKEKMSNASPVEIAKMERAFNEETSWLGKHKEFDALKAQNRKKYLYQETKRLQQLQAKGQSVIAKPEADLVKDKFAQAYREAIEELGPEVKNYNRRFEGLDEVETATSKLVERSMEELSPTERLITQVAGRPSPQSVAAAAVRELPFMGKSIGRLTGRIEKLYRKFSGLSETARRLQTPAIERGRFVREFEKGLKTTPKRRLLGYESEGVKTEPMIRYAQPKGIEPAVEPKIEFAPTISEYEKLPWREPIKGEGFTATSKEYGLENLARQRMEMIKKARELQRSRLGSLGEALIRRTRVGD